MRVLVIEDEAELRETVVETLREEGFATDYCGDGEEGLYKALHWDYDAILLDIMLPKINGWEVLKRIRDAQKETPVMMLTARDGIDDRIKGLNQGADDYLPKPFDLAEMIARTRAIARRSGGQRNPELRIGNVIVNTTSRQVTLNGQPIELTAREYALTELFVRKVDEVVTRDYIYEHLFDENEDSLSNILDVYIYKLRQKLGKQFIRTMRGHGYITRSQDQS
ncbi:response regulator transcription factor [Coraliomargarita akajimensis]|uniref:Two component transcriptional regulator, winged helix family n=1 Tax=Coraliomargarita akajimensis (strain DSM 45221 / IAM 15411 / JCM 23193 / KCTC 12865 / 04OKA010-24) TaxID=583355 RepID=D5EL95_CORAD|nr:two component transcriptional regulator, winged helix family [Coraliomargarita akajimensis DSM 45221]